MNELIAILEVGEYVENIKQFQYEMYEVEF